MSAFPALRRPGLALLTSLLTLSIAQPGKSDVNDDLELKIAALIASHNLALPISFVPDPVFGIPASAVTFGTNLGLKDTRAIFVTPGDWADWPNTDDGCHYEFDLDQSTADYKNLLGFATLRNVPGTWGDLTLSGQVQVVHANTDVNVHVANEHILPDWLDPQTVAFPPGQHDIDWRAETQISDAFDIIIPAALLTYNSIKYGSAVANQGWSAARQAASQDAARQVIQNIAIELGLVTASQLFNGRTSVVHERDQLITIYKEHPPEITTDQPVITLEATDFGGVLYQRVADALRATIEASDPCGLPFTLGNDAPALLGVGDNVLTWTVRDNGPLPGGGFNSDFILQQITVEDTQAPILVAPPSRVIEIPAVEAGLDAASVQLGAPRVVDLADPDPSVDNDGPSFYPIDSRSPITWTATDASGNASQASQLITIKTEGSNTAPTVQDVTVSTLTSEPVDLVLSGQDGDFLDGAFDPLSFRILQRPLNGEFVAPLYPFFIEDYRTSPGGPYGEAFYLSDNRAAWLFANVCQVLPGPNADKIDVDWVYEPEFVHVDDAGKVYMVDRYWQCSASSASSFPRISTWDQDGNFIGQIQYEGANDAFVLDRDGFIYEFKTVGSGSSTEVVVNRCATDFEGKAFRSEYCDSLGSINSSNSPVNVSSARYARVDSAQGLLYVTDQQRVHAFDIRNDPPAPIFLGTLNQSAPFPEPTSSCAGSSLLGWAMEIDSEGSLYMVNCINERIDKFSRSYFDDQGNFIPGDYVGWMGSCTGSTNNACDMDRMASKGFACTDATCSRAPLAVDLAGDEPGQFDEPLYIAVDPNDVLYVAEWGNYRIQRFATDGSFAGQAQSTGTGVNQGAQPGFVLGNMGRPRAVSVNSNQFFVVDREEGFLHVFETSPLKDITENSATVTYVSNFDFHSAADGFQFVASDGLDESNIGLATINVARNFRPPVTQDQALSLAEDSSIELVLSAEDPDGILGIDFNGLDILSYQITEAPTHGTLALVSSDNESVTLSYTPHPDYFGTDRLRFVANDGVEDSGVATIDLEIIPVDDPPRILENELPARVGLGFPFVLRGVFEDDGATDYFTSVIWDGSSTVAEGGVNETNPNNPFIEGVLLVEPLQGKGNGYGIAQHVFTTPGVKTVRFCILDQDGQGECLTSEVTAEPLVNLGLELPEDQGETPPPEVPIGSAFTIDVIVGNLLPEGVSGLIAQAIAMQGVIETPGVVFTGASEGSCTISPDGQSMNCDFGDFAAGEQRLVTLSFATDSDVPHDTDATIRLSFTTESEAVNEVTEAYLTRTIIDPDIIHRDRFAAP
ncbi:Ig-like domain-containing protein [Wenzhouxiangella marina]|uniref:Uncharacterized protein n=1 Tax=Wenzhouxiangella marina TaxID=1579979 RepID=A0A0K0XTQ8_9GAMM|nr:Ig-like domain-containing protein [Wenzhouxiangella marina]AKS41068.1 hypothetical protein WM2015_687 [Wenzhouxiangella marina]MBB6087946.1 hypothetical protein [Wenzhouxiangella marina]